MRWELTTTEQDGTTHQQGGETPDPFYKLATDAGTEAARISYTVGRATEYGEVKASCTVSIICCQSVPTMDYAAELAMDTALKYVNHGMSYLAPGIPALPGPITNGS